MRKESNLNSEIICTIPFKDKVEIITKSNENIKIDNISGNWEKILWNGKSGWVFNGYLKEKQKSDPYVFYLFNKMYYDSKEVCKIIEKYYPNYFDIKYLKAELSMFNVLPYYLPGDKVIVISKK